MHQPPLELLNKKHIILADDTPERQALLKNVVRDGIVLATFLARKCFIIPNSNNYIHFLIYHCIFKGLRISLCNATAKENLKPDDFWSIPEYLETSALQKANEVEELFHNYGITPDIVIGCDTYVKVDGIMYNKPKEEENVFKTLKTVSGKSYIVNAGVTIKMNDKVVKFTENTKVFIRELSDNDIRAYVATGEPFNKTASCGLYGIGGSIIDKIEGDFFTVIGLPLLKLGKELEKLVS